MIAPHDPDTRVGFSSGTGLLSRVIRFFTRAPCSHVWLLYFDHDFEEDMVMEAGREWRLIPYRDFEKKNRIVAIFRPTHDIDSGLREGGRLLGSRYDVEGLVGNLWVLVGEWLKRRWRNPFRSNRMVFCSEGVARVLIAAQYPGVPPDVHSVRPEHLLGVFQTDGSARVR